MHYFEKDPKKQEKNFFKHFWDFNEEPTKQTDTAYVNKEVEMWEQQLKQKAQQFMENDEGPEWMKEYYQSQNQLGQSLLSHGDKAYQQKLKQENELQTSKLLNKLPEDAPAWL